MSLEGMAAVTCVPLTKVVVRAAPFHCTTAPETKLLPLTVSVKAAPPAVALFGTRVVRVGTGLVEVIVTLRALEVPPPGAGLTTVTGAVPAAAMSLAGMAAVSAVTLTKAVGHAEPVHWTTEPDRK